MGLGDDFSAVINGVEHDAQDMESLVSKATGELESLGIGVTGGIEWLVKYLIEAGEDPVAVISQLSSRISSLGGDIVGTLEELAFGIMTSGLTSFTQKKVSEVLAPLQESLHQSTTQGQKLAAVHQTTLKTMRMQLDALTLGGNPSGLTWQGQSVEEMNVSFDAISGIINELTTAFEAGGPQTRLNIICGMALAGIVVIGAVVLLCEFAVTCIVAIVGLATGPGDLLVLGGGAALMAETLEVLEMLVAADLLAWLLGSIAIYVTSHPTSLPHTVISNNGPQGVNTVYANASDLPINPSNVVAGGRIYIPPKWSHGKPAKVRDGFVDAQGNVWEWAPANARHGGPHWDVQHADDSHTNVAPNGKVIGKDNFPNSSSLKK